MPTIQNVLPGKPDKLGPTVTPDGINFAVYSSKATRIELLLFDNITDREPSQVIPLDAKTHRTGDIWHVLVSGLPNGALYNYRADGPYTPGEDGSRFNPKKMLLDPYAPAITRATSTGELGDALGYDNSKPDDPDRHLRPSDCGRTSKAPRDVWPTRATSIGKETRHPEHPDRADSIIYEVHGPGLHPAPLVGKRPRRDVSRVHREDSPT